jgi:putative ABC transport system permease protein
MRSAKPLRAPGRTTWRHSPNGPMSTVQPLRHAWRSLRRTPVFTSAAALTLVIGIGASVAIFAVLNGVLLKPLPYGDPDRLVGMWFDMPGVGLNKTNQSSGTYYTFKRLVTSIENAGVSQEGAVNFAEPGGANEPQRITSAWISASLIPTLQVSPLLGRIFTESEDVPNGPNLVIISEGVWRNRFGADPRVIGRSVDINGLSREIIGVMPERFRFPSAGVQVWLPLQLAPNAEFTGGFNYDGVARLKRGVSLAAAQREFVTVLPRILDLFPNMAPGFSTKRLLDQAKPRPFLVPLRQDVTGSISKTLWMVAAAAGLVLLVACANVANLVLVRADGRQRELAVREALGAGRARVMGHFFSESAILAGIAGAIGLGVAWVVVRTLVAAGPVEIPRLGEVHVDAMTVSFAVAITAFVALLCAIIPAVRANRVPLANALREGGRSGTAGRAQHRLRGSIVAMQMALALVALAGSGLLLRSFQQLNRVEPGFDAENVATLWTSLPRARYESDTSIVQFYSRLSSRLSELPGVVTVGLSSRLPLVARGMNQNPMFIENDPMQSDRVLPLEIFTTADAGYFRALGIPLLVGRIFEPIGVQREGEAIISQRTAEEMFKDPTGRSALGKRFRNFPTAPWFTIIGVVGDARDTSLASPPSRTVYFPQIEGRDSIAEGAQRTMAVVLKTRGEPTSITKAVQGVVREIDPTLPTFDVRPMTVVMRASMAQLSFTSMIIGAAAVVTLLLGAIGLYGVMAYLVTLRTRELGVRIALGAQPRSVAAMMTRQALVLAAIGIAGGLVVFAVIARFLRSFLFGVSPNDPITLVAASTLLIGIAALAGWIPARRASRVDPANTLRSD